MPVELGRIFIEQSPHIASRHSGIGRQSPEAGEIDADAQDILRLELHRPAQGVHGLVPEAELRRRAPQKRMGRGKARRKLQHLPGEIGRSLDETFQKKYKVKIVYFYDYGFRHFWNNRKPINTPDDLKGLKMRVQQGRVFADTVNGLGASAVPMPWGEVVPAAQQGVIDGADLPIYNINALKVYEVSKYVSMTFHNYGPTLLVMNLGVWKSLTPDQQKLFMDVGREAQKKVRELTESVDNLAKAKEILEPKGMKVNAADVASFRKIAEEKIWPQYKQQYGEFWDRIVATR